jgi:hypothetical protein
VLEAQEWTAGSCLYESGARCLVGHAERIGTLLDSKVWSHANQAATVFDLQYTQSPTKTIKAIKAYAADRINQLMTKEDEHVLEHSTVERLEMGAPGAQERPGLLPQRREVVQL